MDNLAIQLSRIVISFLHFRPSIPSLHSLSSFLLSICLASLNQIPDLQQQGGLFAKIPVRNGNGTSEGQTSRMSSDRFPPFCETNKQKRRANSDNYVNYLSIKAKANSLIPCCTASFTREDWGEDANVKKALVSYLDPFPAGYEN